MTHWKIIVIQLAAVMAVRAYDLGQAWITEGGIVEAALHPMLAGVLALIFLAAPHLLVDAVDEDY